MSEVKGYNRPAPGSQPEYLHPPYASSVKRSPRQPLVLLPHTLSELTGPLFGYERMHANDADLTRQHGGEPLGAEGVECVREAHAAQEGNTLQPVAR